MSKERLRLSWVETLGGPHLVLPEKYAPAWEGGQDPSGGRVVEASFRCNPTGPATDYDRASSVPGWTGVLPVGRGQALVLTGDRDMAAYYRPGRGRHFFLRWVGAESETALLDHLHDVWDRLAVEEEVPFRHPGGPVFLMDSVDVPGRWRVQPATIPLPRGRYRVQTSRSETDEVMIVVHELRPDRAS